MESWTCLHGVMDMSPWTQPYSGYAVVFFCCLSLFPASLVLISWFKLKKETLYLFWTTEPFFIKDQTSHSGMRLCPFFNQQQE